MTQERRCGDKKQDGFWAGLSRLFNRGAVKGLVITVITAVIIGLGATLWSLPAKYAQVEAMSKLSDAHKFDVSRLDDKKMDKDEYEKRHTELKEHIDSKLTAVINAANRNEKMLERLLNIHISNKNRAKEE